MGSDTIGMADLLRLQTSLTIFRGSTDETPEIAENPEVQMQLGDYLGPHKQTVAANATVSLSLPSAPYDGIFWLECSSPVRLNVNTQGNQVVDGQFQSMASTSTVSVTNNIVPPGETEVQPVTIRYLAAKRAA